MYHILTIKIKQNKGHIVKYGLLCKVLLTTNYLIVILPCGSAYDAGKGFDTGIVLDVALVDYISDKLGGTIGADYAEPQGRITIVTK